MNVYVPYRYVSESSIGWRRQKLWSYCHDRWVSQGCNPIEMDVSRPDFNRSAVVNEAARLAFHDDGADVLVVADADVAVVEQRQVIEAAATAVNSEVLAFAHTWRSGVGSHDTDRILDGIIEPQAGVSHEWDARTWSSVWAIGRPLWERVHGFDERFIGWGGEDVAFKCACATLGGLTWVPGTVVHLWHDRVWEERENRPQYWENDALFRRYQAAEGSPEAMRAIIAERG